MPRSPNVAGKEPPHTSPCRSAVSFWMSAGLLPALIDSVADCVPPFADAEITGENARPLYRRYFGLVQIVNVAPLCPAGTVMLGKTAASALIELARTTG